MRLLKKVRYADGIIMLLIIGLFQLLSGCNTMERRIALMKKRPLDLCLDSLLYLNSTRDSARYDIKTTNFIFVVYMDSLQCVSCEVNRLPLWNDLILWANTFDGDFGIVFIFSPSKEGKTMVEHLLPASKLMSGVYIDESHIFTENNPHIPSNPLFHKFLLDRNGNVLLVGDPTSNTRIEKLLREIVTEKFTGNAK